MPRQTTADPTAVHLSQLVGGTITGISADTDTTIDHLETVWELNVTTKEGKKVSIWCLDSVRS